MGKAKIIVIDGTDGSGKATQTELLEKRLKEEGYKIFKTSFPNYESPSSELVKMYLKGEISNNASDILPKAASLFYAADRYITFKKVIEKIYDDESYIILLDRYTGSNVIHQGAKILQSNSENKEEEYDEFVTWLDKLEHDDLKIPRADKTKLLHVQKEYTIK